MRVFKAKGIKKGCPDLTEARFKSMCIGILRNLAVNIDDYIQYEPIKLKITDSGNNKYTPDFGFQYKGTIFYVEVKGSYPLPSESRARLAFYVAVDRYPQFCFIWAREKKGSQGVWNMEVHPSGRGKPFKKKNIFGYKAFESVLEEADRKKGDRI